MAAAGLLGPELVLTIRDPKCQLYTVKSLVIVKFAYCDTFLWSQQCHNKREATYHNGVSNQLCIHFARLTLKDLDVAILHLGPLIKALCECVVHL